MLVATGLAGVQRVAVDNPAHPTRVSQPVAGLALKQVERTGEQVFTLNGTTISGYVEQVNGTLTRDSTASTRLAALGNVERFTVSPRRLWAVSGGAVSSVGLPAVDQQVSLLLGLATVDVAGDEAKAVVALGRAGAAVVQVDAAGTLRQGALIPAVHTDAVAVDGMLALLGGPSGLALVDLSVPSAPMVRASLPTAGPVRRVRLAGRLALVSEGSAGVELWNVSQPDAPVLLGRLSAPRADDAVVAAGHIVVADGLSGVKVFPLPAAAVNPSARLLPVASSVEAGAWLELSALVAGAGVDTAEILMNGQVLSRLDEGAARGRYRVSPQASVGQTLMVQVKARTSAGTETLSAPHHVRISAPSSLPALSLSITAGNLYDSGQIISVGANLSGAVAPTTSRLRWAGQELGTFPGSISTGYVTEYVRLPVVAADTTAPLEVFLVDAAGRTQTASVSITVRGLPTSPPSNMSGLPTVVYGPPYINSFWVEAYCYSECSLRLERNGVTVASNASTYSGWQSLYLSFVLPEEAVGTQQTLVAIAEDAAGRQTRLEKTYTVLRDDLVPSVSFSHLPSSAVEGSTQDIWVNSSFPPGHRVRSLGLLINGAEHASTATAGQWSVPYTFPSASEGSVLFEAIATDHLGRQGRVQRSVPIVPDMPPVVRPYAYPYDTSKLIAGQPYYACIQVTDDVQVTSSWMSVDNEQVWSCTSDWCDVHECYYRIMPNVSEIVLSAEATDSRGQTRTVTETFPVEPDRPPQVQVSATYQPFSVGRPFGVCYSASDEVSVTSVRLKVDGTQVWSCSDSYGYCANSNYCPVIHPGPASESMELSVEATDSSGQTSVSTRTYQVSLDQQPPVAELNSGHPVYLIAGSGGSLGATFTDNSHIRSGQLRVNNSVVQELYSTSYPRTSDSLNIFYTAASPGTVLVSAEVEDGAGLRSVAQRSLQVLTQGSGTCEQPAPFWGDKPGSALNIYGQYAPCMTWYYGGGWYELPFDGPVNRIRFERMDSSYYSTLAIADGCGTGAQVTCSQPGQYPSYTETLETGPLQAGARIYSSYFSSLPRIAWARLGHGTSCDVNSTTITCDNGTCEQQPTGEYRCVASACSDGVDNDGDGLVDFPEEFGCEDGADTDEQDPPVRPACSNSVDDDGDGLVDWPDDPYCQGRGQLAEDGQGDTCADPRELRALTHLSFAGAGDELALSCQPTASKPDRVMSFELPANTYYFSVTSSGLTGLALQTSCSDTSTTQACTYSNYLSRDYLAPGTYFLIAEGDADAAIRPDAWLVGGSPCNPSVPWVHCWSDRACLPAAGGGFVCRGSTCSDSADNDGDGSSDYPWDPGCTSWTDDDETDPPVPPACGNGVDDDLDGRADYPSDPGCASKAGTTEQGSGESCADPLEVTAPLLHLPLSSSTNDEVLACDRGARRDRVLSFRVPGSGVFYASGIGLTGLAVRGNCSNEWHDRECSAPLGNASATINMYLDTGTWFLVAEGSEDTNLSIGFQIYRGQPCDPASSWMSCAEPSLCLPSAQGGFTCRNPACVNGRDDDGDGLTDYPLDPGCESATDTDEMDAVAPACRNGTDDDSDGLTDWPHEPGCATQNDEDEADPSVPTQCSNGVDDDGDGQTDFGIDEECSSAGSDNEGLFHGVVMEHLPAGPLPIQVPFQATSTEPLLDCFQTNSMRKRVFQWVAPLTGEYVIPPVWSSGRVRFSVHSAGPGAREMICANDYSYIFLRAGEEVIITVGGDDMYGGNGDTGLMQIYFISELARSIHPPLLPPPEPAWDWTGGTPWVP